MRVAFAQGPPRVVAGRLRSSFFATGVGHRMTGHEGINGSIDLPVNNVVAASVNFGFSPGLDCTRPGDFSISRSDEKKRQFLSRSVPIALLSNDTIRFACHPTESNIHRQMTCTTGQVDACTPGHAFVTDLRNIADPQWQGTVETTFAYVLEPASLSLPGLGLLGLLGVRRAARAA